MASAPPPDLRSSFRPTYNLAVNLASRFDRETADDVLRRSFAQWQARRADLLTVQLSHRVAVLEELGYLDGWSLTPSGHRLARIYHESDLLIAEALAADLLSDADPSVLAGVVSAVVFEPRRARPSGRCTAVPGPGPPPGAAAARARWPTGWGRSGWPSCSGAAPPSSTWPSASGRSRSSISSPAPANPRPGLATAVASWARGASFETALAVAARDVGDLAPGDFVRTVKSVADLVQQLAHAATDPVTAASARAAVGHAPAGRRRRRPAHPLIIRHALPHPSPMVGRPCSPT